MNPTKHALLIEMKFKSAVRLTREIEEQLKLLAHLEGQIARERRSEPLDGSDGRPAALESS
jgi:hypothetical protein